MIQTMPNKSYVGKRLFHLKLPGKYPQQVEVRASTPT